MNEVTRTALDSTTFNLRSGSLSLTLRFSGAAMAALKPDIGGGYLSPGQWGPETGGILVGDMAQQGSQWAVMVDAVTPVPIEYQYGPSYRLSTADKQRFRELAHAGDFGSRPIGWYRANTRPEKEIDEADRQISQTFFGVNQSLFLLCEPSPGGNIHATCVIMLPRRTEVAFPFELGEFSALDTRGGARKPEVHDLGKAMATSPAFTPVAMPAPAPAPRIATAPVPLPAPIVAGALMTPRNMKIGVAVAVGGLIFWYGRGRLSTPSASLEAAPVTRASAPPPAPLEAPALGLRAEYQGNSLLLGWDRAAPSIAAAVSGTVTIADGAETRILRLTPRDLRNGSILYKPAADDIDVELAVSTASGNTGSQSIRIIGAAPPVVRSEAAAAWSAPRAARLAPQVIPQPSPAEPKRAAARFEPPPASATPALRSVSTPDAPALTEAAQPESGTILLPSAVLLPPSPANAPPSGVPPPAQQPMRARTPPSPQSPPGTSGVGSTAAPASLGTISRFEPAVAIHSPMPPFPSNAALPANALDQPVELKVEIHIDTKGRVTSAKVAEMNHPYGAALAPSALGTARSWVFRPAMLGGQPIESTMVLTFRYRSPGPRE